MLSLLIILVSGLFVGLVLGLQGCEILQRYGSSDRDAMGTMVALSLVRELGPVVAGLLVRQPGRFGGDRRDRPDEGHRAAQGDGHDGGQPHRPGRRAALLGRVISMPLLAALFSAMGIFGGWLIGVVFDRRR